RVLPAHPRLESGKTSGASPSGWPGLQAHGRRWDRDGDGRRKATRLCCVRAVQTGWQRGPWANFYCKQEQGFGRIRAARYRLKHSLPRRARSHAKEILMERILLTRILRDTSCPSWFMLLSFKPI